MPRIYRSIFVAALGVALLGADKPPKQGGKPDNSASHGEITYAANAFASAIVQAVKTSEKDGGCNEGKDERHSDLCAQWKAADAARNAADYSFWTLLISTVGTSLLVWTLWETRQASRRELRAYIMVDKVTAVEDHDAFRVTIEWKNCGLTPAHNIKVSTKLEISAAPDFLSLPPFDPSASHIGAGNTFKSKPSLPYLYFYEHYPTHGTIWLCARVTYNDIFGKSRKTDICFEYNGGTEFRAGPCDNVAT